MQLPTLTTISPATCSATNLRPVILRQRPAIATTPQTPGLAPVGIPRAIADGMWRPLAHITTTDNVAWLFVCQGLTLAVMRNASDAPATLATLPAQPLCASPDRNRLIIMTDQGPWLLMYYDGAWRTTGNLDDYPAITFEARDYATLTATVGAFALSRAYDHQATALADIDHRSITTHLLDKYRGLCAQARQSNLYLQPVMVYARIVDANGTLLHLTPPVIVGHPQGLQCAAAIDVDLDADNQTLATANLSAQAFTLAMIVHGDVPEYWQRLGATVQVMVSPSLHPIDPDALAEVHINNTNSQAPRLHIHLPGAVTAQPDVAAAVHALMAAVDDDPKHYFRQTAIGAGCREFAYDARRLAALRQADVATDYSLEAQCAAPHRFIARGAAVNGHIRAWHSIEPWRHAGYAPLAYATALSTDATPWRATAIVNFADGTTVGADDMGTDCPPSAFSPLVAYPAADATAIHLTISAGQGVMRSKLPLTHAGRWSYHLNPSLAQSFPTEQIPFIVAPTVTRHTAVHAGTIAVAPVAAPLAAQTIVSVGDADCVDLSPSVSGSSTWSTMKAGLFAYTTHGIYALAVSRRCDTVDMRLVDTRVMATAGAWAFTPRGLMALAGGDLIMMSRGAATKTVAPAICADPALLAFVPTHHELWIARTDGAADVPTLAVCLNPALPDGLCYHRHRNAGGAIVSALQADSGSVFALDADRGCLTQLDSEVPAEVYIQYLGQLRHTGRLSGIRHVSVSLFSSRLLGNVTLRHDHDGQGLAYTLLDMAIDGPVRSPITTRAYTHPAHFFTVAITATAAPDTILRDITIAT